MRHPRILLKVTRSYEPVYRRWKYEGVRKLQRKVCLAGSRYIVIVIEVISYKLFTIRFDSTRVMQHVLE